MPNARLKVSCARHITERHFELGDTVQHGMNFNGNLFGETRFLGNSVSLRYVPYLRATFCFNCELMQSSVADAETGVSNCLPCVTFDQIDLIYISLQRYGVGQVSNIQAIDYLGYHFIRNVEQSSCLAFFLRETCVYNKKISISIYKTKQKTIVAKSN